MIFVSVIILFCIDHLEFIAQIYYYTINRINLWKKSMLFGKTINLFKKRKSTIPKLRKHLLEEVYAFAHMLSRRRLSQENDSLSLSLEGRELRRVTGLWNMQEWPCAATCGTGKQQRVSRVQTPRHFVHPWIICGAMPNANTTTRHGKPFNMHAPTGWSCTRVPKTPTTNKPAAPSHQSLASGHDNNRYFLAQRASRFTRNFSF